MEKKFRCFIQKKNLKKLKNTAKKNLRSSYYTKAYCKPSCIKQQYLLFQVTKFFFSALRNLCFYSSAFFLKIYFLKLSHLSNFFKKSFFSKSFYIAKFINTAMSFMPAQINFSCQEKEEALCKTLNSRGRCLEDKSFAFKKNFRFA